MDRRPVLQNLAVSVIERCNARLEPADLRAEVVRRLRRAVPVDALWFATVDPATLLFTSAYREEIPERVTSYFVENEFLDDDVNKWVQLARDRRGVRTLAEATGGKLEDSARYREVFEPLGLGDERELHVSPHTVREHLKSIFDKVGVRSSGQLSATILQQHYLPRARAGQPIGPSGFYAE